MEERHKPSWNLNNNSTSTRRTTAADRKAWKVRQAIIHNEARAIVKTGVCPDCGTKLIRNNSLKGWWQCGAFPCDEMRREEFAGLPKCDFQTFTD